MAETSPVTKNRMFRYYYDLTVILVAKEIKLRYKNTFLGFFWSLLNPLILALIFHIAFKRIMRIDIENYTLFLLSGLFPWQWLSTTVSTSPTIFIDNASLLKKVKFPRWILPLSSVGNNLFHFIFTIPVYMAFLLIEGKSPNWLWLPILPLLIIIQFIFISGISFFTASLNVFFRDLLYITHMAMTILFYLTPIIYSEAMIPKDYQLAMYANPISPLIISWRDLLLNNIVRPQYILMSLGYACLIFAIGFALYKRLEWKFAETL